MSETHSNTSNLNYVSSIQFTNADKLKATTATTTNVNKREKKRDLLFFYCGTHAPLLLSCLFLRAVFFRQLFY